MRRRRSTSPGMLYAIAGVLIAASAQSVRETSTTVFYAMMAIGILLGIVGLIQLLRSNNG